MLVYFKYCLPGNISVLCVNVQKLKHILVVILSIGYLYNLCNKRVTSRNKSIKIIAYSPPLPHDGIHQLMKAQ